MQNIRNNIAVSIIVALFLLCLAEITAHEALPEGNAQVNDEQGAVYVLKEYNGVIALFSEDDSLPCQIYDVIVRDLPEADIAALIEGVSISSDEQLRRLIEDYSG